MVGWVFVWVRLLWFWKGGFVGRGILGFGFVACRRVGVHVQSDGHLF